MKFYLDNMTCGGCARTVTRAIQSIDAGASIITDPSTRLVQIQTSLPEEDIVSALGEAGFSPRSK
ncbi:heavy-metal-associated domain-containing protein [Paraburkholderia guartelaensis]|uniref:heavy-metal-associated domain-containing protein n=1 Tax=Paraburkholderia guartelaensis TaxID=2546446 RepID=UPI002AB7DE49|nr:heavy-metal-associated domain-containing protein [Paraburkholderia guartelaensis]